MRRLRLDARGIPTGESAAEAGGDAALGLGRLDDAFALDGDQAMLGIEAAGRARDGRVLRGYRYAQVYAPTDADCVALEPMTAPTAALSSGRGLTVIGPGQRFDAAFRIVVA